MKNQVHILFYFFILLMMTRTETKRYRATPLTTNPSQPPHQMGGSGPLPHDSSQWCRGNHFSKSLHFILNPTESDQSFTTFNCEIHHCVLFLTKSGDGRWPGAELKASTAHAWNVAVREAAHSTIICPSAPRRGRADGQTASFSSSHLLWQLSR